MRPGGRAWGTIQAALVLSLVATAASIEHGSGEVRVLSVPGGASIVTVQASPRVVIEDRTPGALPASDQRGPASAGHAFRNEVTIFLRGFVVPRPAAIGVDDAVVTTVRLFPRPEGTEVTVFLRQPVTYTVSQPSAIGEVAITLRTRARGLTLSEGEFRRPAPTSPEIAVDAESLSYDQQTDTLTARGGVTLTRGDTILTADEVLYDRGNEVVHARGRVVLSDPELSMEGDFLELDLTDESGWVDQANARLRPTEFFLRAGRLEKHVGPQYSVLDGVFTSCECGGLERPSWSLAGERTDVRLEGAGVVRGLTFRVKDAPVLWLPYFVFPARTQRHTGFLMPRVGFSNRRGVVYEQPFYWAISKSTDATFALDLETEARIGAIGEYRYALSRRTEGEFGLAYYNERFRGRTRGTVEAEGVLAEDIPENRFGISGRHRQPFYGKSRFYLDLFAVSDDLFLREINSFAFSTSQDLALRSTRYTTSRAGLLRRWRQGLADVQVAYLQDLVDPEGLTPQRLPALEASHSQSLLGERLVGSFGAQLVNFQRDEGFDGMRLDLAPELSIPMRLGRVLHGSLAGRLRETAYHLTDRDQVAFVVPDDPFLPASPRFERFRVAPELPALDRNHSREIAEVHARVGTEVERVYTFRHFGFEKLKHTIQPEAQYLFVPQVGRPISNGTRLPSCGTLEARGRRAERGENCDATLFAEGFLFDEVDAINRRNFVSYGITTRILARGAIAADAPARSDEETREDGVARVDPEAIGPSLPRDAMPAFEGPLAPATPDGPAPAVRELFRASLLHGVDLSRELVADRRTSDIDVAMRLTPVDYLGLSYKATVNFEDRSVRGLSAGFYVREPWWTPSPLARYQTASLFAVSYHLIEDNVNQLDPTDPASLLQRTLGANVIDGSVYLRLGNYAGVTFQSRYDLTDTPDLGPHFLERNYSLRLMSRCNCWILEAGLSDRFNPDERLFRVQLTLVGLGSFGRDPTARNFASFAPLRALGLPSSGLGRARGVQ